MKVFGCWRIGFLGALIGALAACDVERPDTVLSDSVMENVLYDYHIAKALGEQIDRGEKYKRVLYVDYVYKKHGITEAQFDSSMVWFARHPDVLNEIYKKVTDRLRAEESNVERLVALREHKPLTSRAGDSVDVWVWQRIYQLTGMPMDNRITFTLPADSNFKAHDTLLWSVYFTFDGTMYDSLHAPVMALQMRFSNDSVIGDFARVREKGIYTLALAGDTLGDIKEVNGFIYYPRQQDAKPLMMNKISLMRYHTGSVDSLVSVGDSLLIEEALEDTVQAVESVRPEVTVKTPKKEEPRRPTPSEMRSSQRTQEPKPHQPATRIKQHAKLRKVNE